MSENEDQQVLEGGDSPEDKLTAEISEQDEDSSLLDAALGLGEQEEGTDDPESGLNLLDESESADAVQIEDPEIEAIKARVKEMEEEAEKLKEMQGEVEKQMMTAKTGGLQYPTLEEKMETDARSVYVGNVDYQSTAEELGQHFQACGAINRVTILCDKYTEHPKRFAYIEFAEKECVDKAVELNESLFKGRQIKVDYQSTAEELCDKYTGHPRGSTMWQCCLKSPVESVGATASASRGRCGLSGLSSSLDFLHYGHPTMKALNAFKKKLDTFDRIADADKVDLHVHLSGSGDIEFWKSHVPPDRATDDVSGMLRLENPLTDFSSLGGSDLEDKGFQDFDKFQRKFFELRRDILRSDSAILTKLIIHCAQKYSQEKVKYVEFSYLALALIHNAEQIKTGVQVAKEQYGVTVRFLAAFSRVPKIKKRDKTLKDLQKCIMAWKTSIDGFRKELTNPQFEAGKKIRLQFEKDLEKLWRKFSEDRYLASIVVGLDVMGDERMSMYIPFVWEKFVQFRKWCIENGQTEFGFRIHAGEGINVEKKGGYLLMLAAGICCQILRKQHIPVRIGHGVTILQFIKQFVGLYYSVGVELAKKFSKELFQHIPVEACLISNHMLLGDVTSRCNTSSTEPNLHAVSNLLREEFPVALSTDDHGIFDAKKVLENLFHQADVENFCSCLDCLEGNGYFVSNYRKMIKTCAESLLLKEVAMAIFITQLDPDTVYQIVTTSHKYSFFNKWTWNDGIPVWDE